MKETFREQALLLGPRKSLVGVVTEGVGGAADRPAVVILNSGIVHRVGANRMTVTLARALAASGHTAVRFDLSGIGDSEPRCDGLAPLEATLADVREVLDALASSRRADRFVLGGLCSGADHSLVYASSDPRVVGAVLLDPSIPRTARHHAYHYGSRLFRLESWANMVRGKNPLWKSLLARVSDRELDQARSARAHVEEPEVRAFLENAYRNAVEARVQLLAVLTGERSYYRAQLLEAFPRVQFGDRLLLAYLKHADHMFTGQENSARVIRLVVDWMSRTRFAERHA